MIICILCSLNLFVCVLLLELVLSMWNYNLHLLEGLDSLDSFNKSVQPVACVQTPTLLE